MRRGVAVAARVRGLGASALGRHAMPYKLCICVSGTMPDKMCICFSRAGPCEMADGGSLAAAEADGGDHARRLHFAQTLQA